MCESACLRNIQYTRAYTSGCRRRRASASSAHPRHILYTHTGLFIHENHPLMHELGNNPLQLLRCPQFAHPGWRMCETLLAEDQRLGAGDQWLARGRRGALPAQGFRVSQVAFSSAISFYSGAMRQPLAWFRGCPLASHLSFRTPPFRYEGGREKGTSVLATLRPWGLPPARLFVYDSGTAPKHKEKAL